MTPQLSKYLDEARVFFGRHHPIIFFAVLGLALAGAVFALYQVLLITPAPDSANGTSTITGFDETTVQKIKQLHDSSSASTTVTLPSPRPNPFVEQK